MAQLWGGRFTKQTDALAAKFNNSIGYDQRLWKEDIEGSITHATMLGRQGILTREESENIIQGLKSIRDDLENGTLMVDETCEDIHSFIEQNLIERIGKDGKKLHTGRSRNDQVALDMRLFVRNAMEEIWESLRDLEQVILKIMEDHTETYMPGFTHLQKAQPVTLSHHFGAYFEMFRRDMGRLSDARCRMNECPLGAGALAGTTYPLDREFTAKDLSFDEPTRNSMDSVSDRDYCLEFLFCLCMVMEHLSRLSEEIIIWNSDEYRFVELDDAFSTGSSIMPQKKNPDIAELIRGKTGRVNGDLVALLTVMKGLPLAYDKDLQEDKELVFDAYDTVKDCCSLMEGMLKTMTFHEDTMKESAAKGFTNATDAADYLVGKGVAFRDAHSIVGKMVLYCMDQKKSLEELTLEELHSFHPVFAEDYYKAISLKTCVEKRVTKGAPGLSAMEEEIREARQWLTSQQGWQTK